MFTGLGKLFLIISKNNIQIKIFPHIRYASSSIEKFKEIYKNSKNIVVLTGAGVSAESGVPTYRGDGGLWRRWNPQELLTPYIFMTNPSLSWEFHHYARELMGSKLPNAAHKAIAAAEKRLKNEGRKLVVVTQNIDELHKRAGSEDVIELHGSLFKTECTKCGKIAVNTDSPICPSLKGKGAPDPDANDARIPIADLPHCNNCKGLLRPNVVWFGEGLHPHIIGRAESELAKCDLCLVVGTSSVVYPAALFAPQVAARGVPVGEFNVEATAATHEFGYYFEGPCGTTLPEVLSA